MCIFWPIPSTHGHYKAHKLTAQLEAGGGHSAGHYMSKQRIAGNNNICPWHGRADQQTAKFKKEIMQKLPITFVQYGKAGQRRPLMTVKSRRNTPNTAFSPSQLTLLNWRIFQDSVGGIGNNCMD